MTTTLLSMVQKVGESIGDYLSFDTTTNITTNTSVVSTTLTSYDGGRDDYFIDWWIYITEGNNEGVARQISDYTSSTGTLTVRGANLLAESGAVTCVLQRYERDIYLRAINDAIRETAIALPVRVEDRTMVMGNILPDNSFERWSSSSAMTFYTGSNATLAQTTTAGLIRGARGTTSMKVTTSAANGYSYISSDSYPRLLDCGGKSITFKCWAYPEVANDATLVIYTLDKDGTTQTLTSTTTCVAGEWTLLELENQSINDDLDEIQFRFKVATNGKYAYFDSAWTVGTSEIEHVLPSGLSDGGVSQVSISYDDEELIFPNWHPVFGWEITDDGTYKYLKMPDGYYVRGHIRVLGTKPEDVFDTTDDTDTISLDDNSLNLLTAYAKYKVYQQIEPPVSTLDKRRYESESAKAYAEYLRLLPKLRKPKPSAAINMGALR